MIVIKKIHLQSAMLLMHWARVKIRKDIYFFQERRWLNLTNKDINNQKWTKPDLYKHLLRLYSTKVKQVHPDKGGNASTDTFMLVKKAWDMLKNCHSRIIELTQDSDDDIYDLDDLSSVDDGLSDDAKQNESEDDDENGVENVVRAITSQSRTTDNSSEHDAEENESDKGQHDGGQHVVTRGDHKRTNTAPEPHGATGDNRDRSSSHNHSKIFPEPPPNHEFSYRWFCGPTEASCASEGCPRRTSFSPHDWSKHALG